MRGFISHDGNRSPKWPFTINQESPQSRGLLSWLPLITPGHYRSLTDGIAFNNRSITAGNFVIEPLRSVFALAPSSNSGLEGPSNAYLDGGTHPFSFSLWFTTTNASGTPYLITKRITSSPFNGYYLRMSAAGVLSAFTTDTVPLTNAANVASSVNDGLPHHAVINVSSTGGITSFFDGAVGGSDIADTLGSISAARFLEVGTKTSDSWINGNLWDVRFYDRELTEAEAVTIYNPATRWELFQELGQRSYFFVAAAAISDYRFRHRFFG